MELWQVRKRFKALGLRLRKRKGRAPALQQAEEQVLVALCLGERLETELSVLRFARRCTEARMRRLRLWFENTGLLAREGLPLIRRDDLGALTDFEAVLSARGASDAAAMARQSLAEVQSFDARIEDVRVRIARVGVVADQHLAHLERSLQAGALTRIA